jgi:hypothetical protein
MSNFISKVKNFSQKAAEIKDAIQQVPPKVAEIREAMIATTGQLQQLKSEMHHSVADLKADNESSLSQALLEINGSADVFAKAGFVVTGVDLEISPVQRMLVHLAKTEDVHPSVLRALISANPKRRTTHAILSSLLQAKQMAETVELNGLVYSEVAVGVGPIPSVRLCWRMEEAGEASSVRPAAAIPSSPGAAAVPAAPSVFGQGSFFEKRTPTQPAPVAAPIWAPKTTPIASALNESKTMAISPPVAAPEDSRDPLARFKKMPNLSKLQP